MIAAAIKFLLLLSTLLAPSLGRSVYSEDCPALGNIHLPHAKCHKYYVCNNGVKTEMACAAGTLYSHEHQVCDWSANVACNNPCAGVTHHLLLPHEADCGKFYQCDHGDQVLKECPRGTYFNDDIQVCDWPENVQCQSSTGNTDNENSNDNDDHDNGGNENNDNDHYDEEDDNGNGHNGDHDDNGHNDDEEEICPSDGSFRLLAHESDCGKYYTCVWGEKVEQQCQAGLKFNPEISTCDWPANVQCRIVPTTPEPTTETGDSNNDNHHDDNNDHSDSDNHDENQTDSYTTTEIEDLDEATTEIQDLGEATTDIQDLGEITTDIQDLGEATAEIVVAPCANVVFGNIANPDACDSYYFCSGGVTIPLFCSSGHEFDPNTGGCVTITEGGCTWSQQADTEHDSDDDEGQDLAQDEASKDEEVADNEVNEPVELCPAGFFGNVAHESLCNSYYLCSGGFSIQLFCGTGMVFDKGTGSCVADDNGTCS